MAVNYTMLFASRVGTAIGEAGGSPPSHSLISDYFPKIRRGTAFAIFALAVPVGTSLGSAIGGWGNQHFGWRLTFIMVGLPGLLLALLVRLTVIEPPRGYADGSVKGSKAQAPPMSDVIAHLWSRTSFRHMCLATALHSVVWYAGGAFNNAFFQRSHQMTVAQAGYYISLFAAVGGLGTFFGGFAADRLSRRHNDRRWYLWVPGAATMAMVPFQFSSYLGAGQAVFMPSFAIMTFFAAAFFGPSFAMTQALATLRMRSVATSVLLFIQTLIGQGVGPSLVGYISDRLTPSLGAASLRYALVMVGLVNVWAAIHYFWGARMLRQDLEATERLAASG
jgi:MFS family permease